MKHQKDEQKAASVQDLLEYARHHIHGFPVEVVSQTARLDRPITLNETNRPSLNLFGYFDFFAHQRVQIIGRGEFGVLQDLLQKNQWDHIKKFFEYPIPCIFFSHNNRPSEVFIEMANQKNIPILVSQLSTNELTDRIYDFFAEYLYISEVFHGLMMEVFNIGVLILDHKTANKDEATLKPLYSPTPLPLSEYGLELIQRGHCLVADDVVNVKSQKGKHILAFTSKMIAHHMEIAGIGIVNIAHLFGVKSILHQKNIELVVELEKHNPQQEYDLSGKEPHYKNMLSIPIPKILLPVHQGVNIPILIETAVMNHRLKMTGYNPAKEFSKRIIKYTHPSK